MNALERYSKRNNCHPVFALACLCLEVYGEIDESFIGFWFVYKKTGRLPKEVADRLSKESRR
jgi:hypothetical protein